MITDTGVRTLVVVGDRFAEFATLNGAITVSKLANLIDRLNLRNRVAATNHTWTGSFGKLVELFKKRTETHNLSINFIGERLISARTGRRYCHKQQRRNVLITDPQRASPSQFRMLLSIDDECEIMSDHVSGYHIQGMVLIEAARQVFLAVTECFLLPLEEVYYFAINKFNISYHKFAFPVSTDIRFDLIDTEISKGDKLFAKAKISFYQCGECVCEVDVDYSAFPESKLVAIEKKMAQARLNQIQSEVLVLAEESALPA